MTRQRQLSDDTLECTVSVYTLGTANGVNFNENSHVIDHLLLKKTSSSFDNLYENTETVSRRAGIYSKFFSIHQSLRSVQGLL